jgi:hypothetical protein
MRVKRTGGNLCLGTFPTLEDAKKYVESLLRNKSINWRDSGSKISVADLKTVAYQILAYDSLDTTKQWHELKA